MSRLIAATMDFPTILFVVVGGAALVTMIVALVRLRRAAAPRSPHTDLVGKTCVVRSDGAGSAEAEVTDAEGATRMIRIRPAQDERPAADALRSGSSALIYDYDNTGGFFVVSPLAKQRERSD